MFKMNLFSTIDNLDIERNRIFYSIKSKGPWGEDIVEFFFRKSYDSKLKRAFNNKFFAKIKYSTTPQGLSIFWCEVKLTNKKYDPLKTHYEKILSAGFGRWMLCKLLEQMLIEEKINLNSKVDILALTLDERNVPEDWSNDEMMQFLKKFGIYKISNLKKAFSRCFSQQLLIEYYKKFGFVVLDDDVDCDGANMSSDVETLLKNCVMQDF